MATIQEIIKDLKKYEYNIWRYSSAIPAEVKNQLVAHIAEYPSIWRGWFIRSVDYHAIMSGGELEWYVDTSKDSRVIYDGWLEFGAKKHPNPKLRPERWHYRTAIERSDFEHIFDDWADDAFNHVI